MKVNPKFFPRNYGWGNHYPIQNRCPHGKLSMNLPDHLLYIHISYLEYQKGINVIFEHDFDMIINDFVVHKIC